MAEDTIKSKAPAHVPAQSQISPHSQDSSQSQQTRILIQKDLPQHKMQSGAESSGILPPAVPVPSVKEKWSFLKSTLESAVNDWSELEKIAPQKNPEEEQLDKMRTLISNIKDRLKEF